jgi:hypothetical protein
MFADEQHADLLPVTCKLTGSVRSVTVFIFIGIDELLLDKNLKRSFNDTFWYFE